MNLSRREFLQILAAASTAGMLPGVARAADPYDLPAFGNVGLLHYTDCHAQLLPVHFREPNVNLGIGEMKGRPPHLVGANFLEHFGIAAGTVEAHAFTYLDFADAARKYGKVGGFAHLATLVKRLRADRPGSLLLDGGDTWQGSATSLWSNAQDMVDAQLQLGVDIMTPQNVLDTEWEEPVFPAFVTREINGVPVAVIGQAFPYTPIANPRYMVPDWSFGVREERMQQTVEEARSSGAQVVVLLSHNGMDVDLKLASRVSGIDAILGGHTHDAIPKPIVVSNPGGKTLVINSGSNAKFLSVLDLDVRDGQVRDYRFRQLPVFSNLLPADADMTALIEKHRAPYKDKLAEELAVTDSLLYRRGNFNGTFDQLICDALIATQDAQIALSPGFRWGTSLLPGQAITFEDLMTQTAITYPTVTVNEFTGEFIKTILEDVADNLFNEDPYYQQGGDMVRVGGLRYALDPTAKIGSRVTAMELDGKPIDAGKTYKVAGWASVAQPLDGTPVWDAVADYLRDQKTVRVDELNTPKLLNVEGNQGLA
jgi:sulfur-oxidizing protein SoxB